MAAPDALSSSATHKVRRLRLLSIAVSYLLIISASTVASQADETPIVDDVYTMALVVHFIDVGNGDAAVIKLPDRSHEIIIHGGDLRNGWDFYQYASTLLEGPVELTIISHPDYDHWSGINYRLYNGTRRLLTKVWDAGYDRDCRSSPKNPGAEQRDGYVSFITELLGDDSILMERPPPISTDIRKPTFTLDGVSVWVLRAQPRPPFAGDCAFTINDFSLVVRVQYGDVSFLFTGDIAGKKRNHRPSVEAQFAEGELLRISDLRLLDADVLKVPHHGSSSASSRDFIKAVSPRFAIISSSTRHKLPAATVVDVYDSILFGQENEEQVPVEELFRTDTGANNENGIDVHGDDHIVCGTNGHKEDLACHYIWSIQ